jgi:hypothetical protein
MAGTGGLIGWTSWERPLYHSLSARTVFSFNLYDNKLARNGAFEAIVWSGLRAQNSYERMRMILSTHAIVGGAIVSLFPSHSLLLVAAGFASRFAIEAIPHWDYPLQAISVGWLSRAAP